MNVAPPLEHAAAPDPRIAAAEARLVMLRELAEFGMSRLRARYARPGEHPAMACMRLSRAVRCALILERRIEVELAALQAGTWTPPEDAPPPANPKPSKDKGMSAPPVERDSPDRETFGHILKLPFKDAVKWICKEMGMDGDEFLRNHPLTPVACSDPAPARAPVPAPAPAPAPTATPKSCDEVRDAVREGVLEAIWVEFDNDENMEASEPASAIRNLDERLYNTTRYDAVIRLPLKAAVSAILCDLEFNRRRAGEAFPPPDPPPRMARAP